MRLFVKGKEWVTHRAQRALREPRLLTGPKLSQEQHGDKFYMAFWGPLRRAPFQVPVSVELGKYCVGPTISTVMTWAPWKREQNFFLPERPTLTDRQGIEWHYVYSYSGAVYWSTGATQRGGPFLGLCLTMKEWKDTPGSNTLEVRLSGSHVGEVPANLPILDTIDIAKTLAISEMQARCQASRIAPEVLASRFEILE